MKTTTCIKLIILGAVLVAAGLAVREVRRQTSPERVRASVMREFERNAVGELSMDVARLELPGRLRIEGIAVTPPGHEEPLLECDRVLADLDTGSLLKGQTVLRGLRIHSPTVKLRYDREQRRWNFRDLIPARKEQERPAERGRPQRREQPSRGETLADGVTIENGTVELQYARLFRDGEPRLIEGIYVTARADHANLRRWRFQGQIQRGPLQGVRLSGHYAAGQEVPLHIEIDAGRLTADRELWRYVPYGARVWEMFRPEGRVAGRGTLDFPAGGRVRYSFDVTARDVTAETKYAPAPVESLRGGVTVSDAGVFVRDLKGLIPADGLDKELSDRPPVHVRLNSTYEWSGGRRDYVVEADDVPLCRRTFEAIPRFGSKLWERLQPAGDCRFALRLSDPGDGRPMRMNVSAEVRNATLCPTELPRPLENVTANLDVDGDTLSINSFQGLLRQPGQNGELSGTAKVRAEARIPFAGERTANVNVQMTNLRSTPALVRAIPSYGERIWEAARPEVTLDGELSLVREGNGGEWQPTVQLQLQGGRAELDFWPVPLRDLNGALRVTGNRVELQRLSAQLDIGKDQVPATRTTNHVEADGWVDLAEASAVVNLEAQNVRLDRELVTSLPNIGTAIWEQSRPQGICSVAGCLRYRSAAESPVSYLVRMDLHDVSAQPAALPVALSGLSGNMLITEKRVVASDLTGVTCAGTFDGAGVAYYGTAGEYPSYAGTVRFRQLDLEELLEKATGKGPDIAGLLSGTVDVGGVIGGSTGISATGSVSLAEGKLWQTPFFGRLIQVLHLSLPGPRRSVQRGQASFTRIGNKVEVHEFEVVGGGLNISGYGTVGRDNELDMTLVALGEPEPGAGIPVVSSIVGWVMRRVEGVLFRIEVSGTLEDPRYSPTPIRTIMTPLTGLRSVLFSPIFGAPEEENP